MKLSLHNGSSIGVTIISNIFIDHYMPHANGEFVKIYLYLLRCLQGGQDDLNLASVADIFNCTESDIMRILRYWESRQLLVLAGTDPQTSIDFLEPMIPAKTPASGTLSDTDKSSLYRASAAASRLTEAASTSEKKEHSPKKVSKLTADRKRELKEKEDIKQICFIAEQYTGRTLTSSFVDDLLYIYDDLHFSVDLMDYLIEYCVSKSSGDNHYIKKVAFSWYEAGIDTVVKAKQETTTYHKNYFTILKAFGISNRNPVPSEVNIMNHWMNDYGFTLDIIKEACSRTVTKTGKANFQYADKILSDWKEKGVRHLTDIRALDALHRQVQSDRKAQNKSSRSNQAPAASSRSAGNRFNNFTQRNYDYKELENQLLKKQ